MVFFPMFQFFVGNSLIKVFYFSTMPRFARTHCLVHPSSISARLSSSSTQATGFHLISLRPHINIRTWPNVTPPRPSQKQGEVGCRRFKKRKRALESGEELLEVQPSSVMDSRSVCRDYPHKMKRSLISIIFRESNNFTMVISLN